MSAAKVDTSNKKWELKGSWAGAWKIAYGIGGVGLLGSAAGFTMDQRRFAFSWLSAFITVLMCALGMIFFVLIQRLTSAGWSVTVRRTAEFWGYGVLVLMALSAPVFGLRGHLFPWLSHGGHGGEHHTKIELVKPAHAQNHGQPHGAEQPPAPHGGAARSAQPGAHAGDSAGRAPGSGHGGGGGGGGGGRGGGAGAGGGAHASIEHAENQARAIGHGAVIQKKSPYLNQTFFFVRVGIYFLVWALLAMKLFSYSADQDKSKDPELTLKAQRFAPGATMLFALTLTFAVFDWVMSLEPSWFSTIFGVVMFSTGVISSLSVLILVTLGLKRSGDLEGAVTVEHYHDLGKLLFGFLVFWAYVSFSQFMLIWYAALPEETTFFHNRWDVEPWKNVSYALVLFHFVLPFFWLMSRWFKRNLGRLQIGALIILVMHCVDIYWYVMPNYALGKPFSFHWMDLACLLAVGGIYAGFVLQRMTKFPLIPVGDPRLARALNFQNA